MQIKLDESSSSINLQPDMTGKASANIHKQLERSGQSRTQAWRVATNIGSSFRYAAAGVTYAFMLSMFLVTRLLLSLFVQ